MAGRAKVTIHLLPAALTGLVVNVVLVIVLVDPLGIAGAGIALAAAYLAMLAVLATLARRSFAVPFETGRLVHAVVLIGGLAVAGELLLPTDGAWGFVLRALVLALIPLALWLTRFPTAAERTGAAQLRRRARR